MRYTSSLILGCALALGCAVALGGVADAQGVIPPGWAKVETAGFTMGLPKHWKEFLTKKYDIVKEPHRGSWGFMSTHAGSKVLMRVSNNKTGTMAQVLKESETHLVKKVQKLKKVKEIPIAKDPKGRDGLIIFYEGYTEAISRKTKNVEPMLHLILRALVRIPENKIMMTVTHLHRGDKVADAKAQDEQIKFFMDHIQSITPRHADEVKKLIKVVKINTEVPETNSAKGRVIGVEAKAPTAPAKAGAKSPVKGPLKR